VILALLADLGPWVPRERKAILVLKVTRVQWVLLALQVNVE